MPARLFHRFATVHVFDRDPRARVIENPWTAFDVRGGMLLDQLESCAAAVDVEFNLAARGNAEGQPYPLGNGDLPFAGEDTVAMGALLK